ncbi:MAG: hypothetical protein GF333_05045 [Candidatus Omnitrophica bacterium]|nr:hypothetical protein [Candidatus Omnitrophota bacterium]
MNAFKIILLIVFLTVPRTMPAAFAQTADSAQEAAPEEEIAPYVAPSPGANVPSFGSLLGTIIQICISLAVIVVFVYLTVFVLKKLSGASRAEPGPHYGVLSLVDSLSLGPNKSLYLVYAGRELLVVSLSDKGFSLLSRITEQEAVEEVLAKKKEEWEKAKPFREYLHAEQKKEMVKQYMKDYLSSMKDIFRGRSHK